MTAIGCSRVEIVVQEQPALSGEIRFEIAVEVKVVLGQIGEREDPKVDPSTLPSSRA